MTPRNVTCALCGHGPLKMITECGYRRDPDGRFLCYCDDHDCYTAWTRDKFDLYGDRRRR